MGRQNVGMFPDKVPQSFGSDLDTDPSSLNESLRFQQYHVPRDTPFWSPSQVSLPKGSPWGSPGSSSFDPKNPNGNKYTYNYDIANARDTYVYMINEEGVWEDHNVCFSISFLPSSLLINGLQEFLGRSIEHFDSHHNFGPTTGWRPHYHHGSGVAAQVIGNRVGICPSCTLVIVTTRSPIKKVPSWQAWPKEKVIAQLLDVVDDITTKNRQGKAALTMSFSYAIEEETNAFEAHFSK